MPLRSPAAKPVLPEDLRGAVQALSDGTLTARAYCESRLALIRASEGTLRAWIALDDERALALAAARDAERARGERSGTLHGVPVGRSEEHTSELQSHSDLVCRLLLEKKKKMKCEVVEVGE